MENTKITHVTKTNSKIIYSASAKGVGFSNHIHQGFEILFIIKGNLIYGTDSFKHVLKPNDLVITPAHSYHYIDLNKCDYYERVNISIVDKNLNSILSNYAGQKHLIFNLYDNTILKTLLLNFKEYDNIKHKFKSSHFDKLMQYLIEEICFNITTIDHNANNSPTTFYDPIFLDIISYVNKNIASVTVQDIANKFRMSTTYVYKLFYKFIKISPKKYILDNKFSYAKGLIASGEKLYNVAFKCGYSDYPSFYRTFKKYCETNDM